LIQTSGPLAKQHLHYVCVLRRFVEALLAAGRPATALAVQRARCATSSSSSAGGAAAGLQLSLKEAQVLLRVQLGCGLLAEAFSELRRHCSQVGDTHNTFSVPLHVLVLDVRPV
jgi:hypothetical protein